MHATFSTASHHQPLCPRRSPMAQPASLRLARLAADLAGGITDQPPGAHLPMRLLPIRY